MLSFYVIPDIHFFNKFVSLPLLKKCQIFSKKLVDPLLVDTYADLPKLPRYALYITACISESFTNL